MPKKDVQVGVLKALVNMGSFVTKLAPMAVMMTVKEVTGAAPNVKMGIWDNFATKPAQSRVKEGATKKKELAHPVKKDFGELNVKINAEKVVKLLTMKIVILRREAVVSVKKIIGA